MSRRMAAATLRHFVDAVAGGLAATSDERMDLTVRESRDPREARCGHDGPRDRGHPAHIKTNGGESRRERPSQARRPESDRSDPALPVVADAARRPHHSDAEPAGARSLLGARDPAPSGGIRARGACMHQSCGRAVAVSVLLPLWPAGPRHSLRVLRTEPRGQHPLSRSRVLRRCVAAVRALSRRFIVVARVLSSPSPRC